MDAVAVLRKELGGDQRLPLVVLRNALVLGRVVERVAITRAVSDVMSRLLAPFANEVRWQERAARPEAVPAGLPPHAEAAAVTASRVATVTHLVRVHIGPGALAGRIAAELATLEVSRDRLGPCVH